MNEIILNSKNKIKVGTNSELHLLEFIVNNSEKNFFNNIYEDVVLEKNSAILKIFIFRTIKAQVIFINIQ